MKTRTISLAAILAVSAAATVMPSPMIAGAQTQNQTSRFQITESFTFPNECTNEVMDVADTTTVTCHDQQRADGTFSEKCEIRQDVTATGETTGINWHGAATFKDEFLATDPCNFSFSNRGTSSSGRVRTSSVASASDGITLARKPALRIVGVTVVRR